MTKEKKNKGGRPTKYTDDMPEKIVSFFKRPAYEYKEVKIKDRYGNSKIQVVKEANDLPTFERFAVDNDVHVETLLNWSKEYTEFFEAYKKCKAIQKEILIQNGNHGLYNTAFCIFTAKNCTDMRNTEHVEKKEERTVITETLEEYVTRRDKENE